ncbi:MAG: hypothetical protein ACRD3T_13860, partial [Terriglobia bacterium]
MSDETPEMRIALQVGSELRITNTGEIVIDNPELELARNEEAADAILAYKFDRRKGEHVLRLIDPVADHEHIEHHRPN